MTVRAQLEADLKPHLPRGWRLIPYATNLDVIDQHTVMTLQESIERVPEAPIGAVKVDFKVIIIEPKTDPKTAEDALDDAVTDLLLSLNKARQVHWSRAERRTWEDSNPCYEVAVSYFATLDTE